jgi:hypothetical protein
MVKLAAGETAATKRLQMQQISGSVFSVKKAAEHTLHLSIKM